MSICVYGIPSRALSYSNDGSCRCQGFPRFSRFLSSCLTLYADFLSAWEGAPNDGAWLDEEAEQSQTSIPDLKTPAVERWEWAINAKESHFLTFDIKYRSTGIPDSLGYLTTKQKWCGNAEIFLLCFQGLPKYIAILPRLVARNISRWSASGIAHLISRAPPWVYPFMVHEEHLKEAVHKLLECARTGRCYQNPSTSVKLIGWTPKLQTSPSLSPSGNAQDALQAIRELWDLIKHVNPSVTYDFIPIAPLVADFLLTIQNVTVRVEHKVGYVRNKDGALNFNGHNPFFGGFQWHYIIMQPSADRQKWYCLARHHVPQEWLDNPTHLYIPRVELDKWVYEEGAGRDSVRAILNYICKTAHAAIQNAKASPQNEESIDDIESLLRVDFLPDDDESDSDDEGSDDEGDSLSKNQRDLTGLHWLLEPLNQQCRDSGQLVLIPLDLGHPFGTHIVVKHSWTSEDKEKWDQDRTLPIYGFSPGIADRPCVVMRFWDLCPSLGKGTDHLSLKRRYWLRPFVEQPFLILGSLLRDPKDRITSSHYSPYLFLPSGFTTYFQLKDFRDWGIDVGHPGSGYYRSEKQVLHPQWLTQSHNALRLHRFMKIGTNPEDYILNFQDGSIYKQLLRLINGTEEKMSIRNPQSFDHHPTSFSKKEYLTTMGKVMQASWDYGRRISITD